MAVGLHRMVTKLMARLCKKSWNNLQIIFWAEKRLRFGKAIGLNMETFGQASMMAQNTSCPRPEKSQIGKTQFSSKVSQILKSLKNQKVLTSRYGAVVSSFSCCLRMILRMNSGSKFIL